MCKSLFLLSLILLLAACQMPVVQTPTPAPVPAGPCELTLLNPVNAYRRASAAEEPFATLGTAEPVIAVVKTADGFYGFDPGIAQAGNVGLFRMRWILKTHDVAAGPGCDSLPTVTAPIAGICYAMIMGDIPIYSGPDAASPVLVTLHTDDYAMITASTPDWFTLDLNVGTAGMDALGYLPAGNLGGFNGSCDDL